MPGDVYPQSVRRKEALKTRQCKSQSIILAQSVAALLQQEVFELVTNLPCPIA